MDELRPRQCDKDDHQIKSNGTMKCFRIDKSTKAKKSLAVFKKVRKRRSIRGDPILIQLDKIAQSLTESLKYVDTILTQLTLPDPVVSYDDTPTYELIQLCRAHDQRFDVEFIIKRVLNSVMCMLLTLVSEEDIYKLCENDRITNKDREKILRYRETGEYLKQLVGVSSWTILISPIVSTRSVGRMHGEVFDDLLKQLNADLAKFGSNIEGMSMIILLVGFAWGDYDLAQAVIQRIAGYILRGARELYVV